MRIHRTEVDGVTTIWTESQGPLTAGLLFRTGRVDETLATSGYAHLIEHMALSTLPDAGGRHNGFVGGAVTGFTTIGRPEEVSAYLLSICRALKALPDDRLEAEKQVLEAEASARPYDVSTSLLVWRYGAAGYGLLGLPELGSRSARSEQLHAVVAQRFTSGNAVLWLSGPPPSELRLELPDGPRQQQPPLVPLLPELPCWFLDDHCGGVAVGATVPRSATSSVFHVLASVRLRARLRTKQAVSYAPLVSYDPLDADTAHLMFAADSDRDRRAELTETFAKTFERLSEVDAEEVESARQQLVDGWTGSLAPPPQELAVHEAQRAAMDWIHGRDYEAIEEIAAQAAEVTTLDVEEFGSALQKDALFALPSEARLRPSMGRQAPQSNGPPVHGRSLPSVDAPVRRERLVYGPEGASVIMPDGSHCTVRHADLAAAVAHDDGFVLLIGSDAATISVEPTLWRGGQQACREILESVPPGLLFDRGPRAAEWIPRPETTIWQRVRAHVGRAAAALHGWPLVVLVAVLVYLASAYLLRDHNFALRPVLVVLAVWGVRAFVQR